MRYAVLADIHGNLAALNAVIDDAEKHFHVEAFWSLGDVANYGPQSGTCIRRIHNLATVRVAGNHDRVWIDDGELGKFADDVSRIFPLTKLTKVSLKRLASWPHMPQRPAEAPDFTLVHGSPRDPLWEYVHSWVIAKQCFKHFDTPYCLVGHTHVPRVLEQTDDEDGCREWTAEETRSDRWIELGQARLIINPGSVGQPRDEDPRAAYLVLDLDQGAFLFRRVPYPVEKTQKKMQEVGFPTWLIKRLEHGW